MGVHPEKLPSALEGVFLMGRKPKYSIEDTMIREIQDENWVKSFRIQTAKNLFWSCISQYLSDW